LRTDSTGLQAAVGIDGKLYSDDIHITQTAGAGARNVDRPRAEECLKCRCSDRRSVSSGQNLEINDNTAAGDTRDDHLVYWHS
jgi:hypothetical protein